jgi:hypothetical protein
VEVTGAIDAVVSIVAVNGCIAWLLDPGLQALIKAIPNKTLIKANRILRRRFMLDLLVRNLMR